jgi:hypothetical protein
MFFTKKIFLLILLFFGFFLSFPSSTQATPNTWTTIGSAGFSTGAADYTSITLHPDTGQPHVAFQDATNGNKITAMRYNGSSWVLVGTAGFSDGQASLISIDFNDQTNDLYVGYKDHSGSTGITVKKLIENSWVDVGTPRFGSTTISELVMEYRMGYGPYVAYTDSAGTGTLAMYNSSWTTVGGESFCSNCSSISMAFNPYGDFPYVAYQDSDTMVNVKKFHDDIEWQTVGGTQFAGPCSTGTNIAFEYLGPPYVVYNLVNDETANVGYFNSGTGLWGQIDVLGTVSDMISCSKIEIAESTGYIYAICSTPPDSQLSLRRFVGESWEYVGGSNSFTPNTANSPSLTLSALAEEPYIVFRDGSQSNKATVMKFNSNQTNTPTVSSPEGTYNTNLSITLSSSGSDAIYYTTNGDTPTEESSPYTEAITITQTTTLKAIATTTGKSNSDVFTATYTLKAFTPSASIPGGTYGAGSTQSVNLSSMGSDVIYYTTNGSDPSTSSTQYHSNEPIQISSNTTLKAMAVKTGWSDSDIMTEQYTFLPQVATPTANPDAGVYSSAQEVTLSTTTEGATIYYTTDGSVPTTESSVYTSPLAISSNTTLNFFATGEGMANSNTVTQIYSIADPVYRFRNKENNAYLFSINSEEIESIRENWLWLLEEEGIAFYAFSNSQPETVPLYRFRNKQSNAYLFTINSEEIDSIRSNWSWLFEEEGISFYVYANDSQLGTTAAYRFRNKQNNSYLYSINLPEINSIRQNWEWLLEEEGICFYVIGNSE